MPVPKTTGILNKKSAKDKIYHTVCGWIVRGVLQPGEKVNDAELAQYFGVSRTPVREALMMLELQKLVYVQPGKATIVADINVADIEKCYLPLSEIQALAAKQVCLTCTAEDVDLLRQVCDEAQSAFEKDDVDLVMDSDEHFHGAIMKLADNEYMSDFVDLLFLHINRARYQYFNHTTFRNASMKEHQNLMKALVERDGERAAEIMRAHWLDAKDRLIQAMEKG